MYCLARSELQLDLRPCCPRHRCLRVPTRLSQATPENHHLQAHFRAPTRLSQATPDNHHLQVHFRLYQAPPQRPGIHLQLGRTRNGPSGTDFAQRLGSCHKGPLRQLSSTRPAVRATYTLRIECTVLHLLHRRWYHHLTESDHSLWHKGSGQPTRTAPRSKRRPPPFAHERYASSVGTKTKKTRS